MSTERNKERPERVSSRVEAVTGEQMQAFAAHVAALPRGGRVEIVVYRDDAGRLNFKQREARHLARV